MVTAKRVLDLLEYNPENGLFYWRKCRGPRTSGGCAGTLGADGRIRIWVDGKSYLAHRLAWLCVHGEWPISCIDHINRNPVDNRIANLRLATHSQNLQNAGARANSKSKLRGVSYKKKNKKWVAQIYANGKKYHLGLFDTPEKAVIARRQAEEVYHPFKVSADRRIMEEAK